MTSAIVQTRTKKPDGSANTKSDQARSLRSQATNESTRASNKPPKIVGVGNGNGVRNFATKRTSKRAEIANPSIPRIDFGKNFNLFPLSLFLDAMPFSER